MDRASVDEETHWSLIKQIPCPTLIVRGGDSPFTEMFVMERMAREISVSRLVEIPGAGHDVHIDRFEALLAELWPFLSTNEVR